MRRSPPLGAPARGSSSTTPCSARYSCARSRTAPTSRSTAPRRSSPAITTRSSASSAARAPRITLAWRRSASASGIVAAPDPAWLLLRGIKTLAVRAERQSASALELARRLAGHPRIATVRYPGLDDPVAARYVEAFGPLLSFDVADGDEAVAVERGLRLIENATSLGGVASTLEARARWEGERVPAGLLRLSVGLEDVDDLWADLTGALDAA